MAMAAMRPSFLACMLALCILAGGCGMTVSIGMSGDCPTGVDCSPPTPQPAVQVRPAHVTAQVGSAVSFETVLSNVDVVPAVSAVPPVVFQDGEFALNMSGTSWTTAPRWPTNRSPRAATPVPSAARQWGHEGAYAGLTARDFYQFDGPPCGTGEACPDFSAGAAPLRFGFLRIADAWVEGPVVHGIDNWRVAVWPR